MSFGNYLSEVRCMTRKERVLNLAERLEEQFNGNRDTILEFLGGQGSNYQLAKELIDHFSTLKTNTDVSQPFPDFETATSPLFGSKSTKSSRAFSSICSQLPTPLRAHTMQTRSISTQSKQPASEVQLATPTRRRGEVRESSIYSTRTEGRTQPSSAMKSNQIAKFSQTLSLIKANDISQAIVNLKELDQQQLFDPEVRQQVVASLYQCHHILRDKSSCETYSSRYLESLKTQTHCKRQASSIQVDMLLFQLNKLLKITPLPTNDIQYIIKELTRSDQKCGQPQQAKLTLQQIKFHLLTRHQNNTHLRKDLEILMTIGGSDPKVQKELFGKVGRLTYDVQDTVIFEELFFIIQSSKSSVEITQNRMMFFVLNYLELAKKNINTKYFKYCANLFMQWLSRNQITFCIKSALQICEIIAHFIFDKHTSFTYDEQLALIDTIFKLLQCQFAHSDLLKENIFSLALVGSKFFFGMDNITKTLEMLEISYDYEQYSPNKEGVLLKFKLLQNILNVGLKSKNFDHLHYIYEIDKILNGQVFIVALMVSDKAILCNETANTLLKGKLYRSAKTYYQKALNLVPSSHAIVPHIHSNLRICQQKFQ